MFPTHQVGTTSFDKFIQQIDTSEFLRAVQLKGYKSLTIQACCGAAGVGLRPLAPVADTCRVTLAVSWAATCTSLHASPTARKRRRSADVLYVVNRCSLKRAPDVKDNSALRFPAVSCKTQLGRGVYLPKTILPEGKEAVTLGNGFRIQCVNKRAHLPTDGHSCERPLGCRD